MPPRFKPLRYALLAFWIAAVAAGMRLMLNYKYAPGIAATSPSQWPSHARVRRDFGKPTLVMLAHPRCPCTRASIGELARIMTRCQGKLSAKVLFYKPEEAREDWEQTDLWRSAAAIPGVVVMQDRDGTEAARFRASTSGQTLLYDAQGKLLFSGGITGSRGHSGDNDGEDSIVSLVTTGGARRKRTSVFGCSLLDNRPPRQEEDAHVRR